VTEVIDECTAAGARHPIPRAFVILALIAHRRGRDRAALDHLEDAAAICPELDDPAQLADILAKLSVHQVTLGQPAEAVQSVVESGQLARQIDRGQVRWWPLGAAAVVHMARGHRELATRALGAFDAHAPPMAGLPAEDGGFLAEATAATRARLDAADIVRAATDARRRRLDQLIDELVVHPLSTPA
jgi:hypothetical protein